METEPARIAAPNFKSTTSPPSSGKIMDKRPSDEDELSEDAFFTFTFEQEYGGERKKEREDDRRWKRWGDLECVKYTDTERFFSYKLN